MRFSGKPAAASGSRDRHPWFTPAFQVGDRAFGLASCDCTRGAVPPPPGIPRRSQIGAGRRGDAPWLENILRLNLVLMTQYFDTLKEIGASSETHTILIPHSPGNLSDLTAQMRTAMISADLVTRDIRNHHHDGATTAG